MPKQTAGYDELAAAVAKDTRLSAEQAPVNREDGMQFTLEEALIFVPLLPCQAEQPGRPAAAIKHPLLRAHIDGFGWCAQAKGWKKLSSKLYGFAVSSLSIKVNNYAALRAMIRNDYDGRLLDILDLEV
jgi:hypothetical protein